jgi:hypothetical protein
MSNLEMASCTNRPLDRSAGQIRPLETTATATFIAVTILSQRAINVNDSRINCSNHLRGVAEMKSDKEATPIDSFTLHQLG